MIKRKLKFIDLFAGLGGFHIALESLGHECVFASELNDELRKLYQINHGIICHGDINKVVEDKIKIPSFDILCAGFPCQPFSKAGKQNGLEDSVNGNFFDLIMKIVKDQKKTPEYIFLENVPNLKSHDNGNTWNYIEKKLKTLYDIREQIISPDKLGIPQHRARIYIVGRLKNKGGFSEFEIAEKGILDYTFNKELSINSIIEKKPKEYTSLKKDTLNHLNVWQQFLDNIKSEDAPGFPIWAMEFGATYPYENIAPIRLSANELKKFKGKFGKPIKGHSFDEILDCLPSYAQTDENEFPQWKKSYIKANREFYLKNKKWLDNGLKEQIQEFENSHQKLEWNCGKSKNTKLNLYDKIIQFRPSGIRIKKPTYSPALVLSSTQIPVFPWLERYMTPKEAAKLQGMTDTKGMKSLKEFPKTTPKAFRAFGNAVNASVVKQIAIQLIK